MDVQNNHEVAPLRFCAVNRRWRMPPHLQPLFEIHRASQFRRLLDLWWLSLVAVHVLFSALGCIVLWRFPMRHDEWLYVVTTVFGWSVIGGSIWCLRRAHGLMSRDRWLPWSAFAIHAVISYGVVANHEPAFARYAVALCPVVVIVYTCGLKPSFRAALKFTTLNLAIAPFLFAGGASDLTLQYVVQLLLASVVGLFCVFLNEDRDRDHFMMAVRVHETQTQLKAANQGLDEMAHRDPLTNLPNRRSLNEFLNQEWQRSIRNRSSMAVLMIDIDHFKRFNDLHGHLAGDACLVSVAQAMRQALQRPGDAIARFGGEEFVVVLADTDLSGAQQVARRILQHVDDLGLAHEASDTALHVTVSIGGVVLHGRRSTRAADLLKLADDMLYRVKAQGRHGMNIRHVV